MNFKFLRQHDIMDCGPTCLLMMSKFYGREYKIDYLRKLCEVNKDGVSMLGVSQAAEKIGFDTLGARLSVSGLREYNAPCILHWRKHHFVVLYKIRRKKFYLADPAIGLVKIDEDEFVKNWIGGNKTLEGIALFLDPQKNFLGNTKQENINQWKVIFGYFTRYKKLVFQLILGLAFASILQLITPLLTQSMVDTGIEGKNLNYVYIILIAQAMLIIGRTSIDFIRSWILLHISIRINISILTDFLIKLMKLPISYFDSKMTGDILQRINDQKRIESFLTGSVLSTLFYVINLIVFSFVLIHYNCIIFAVFLLSSCLYGAWIISFLERRKSLDYSRFEISAQSQSSVIQLISGMQEIKLNNCEDQKRLEWESVQASLFKFNIKSLGLSQYQQGGATFINESANLLISFLCARAVIQGNLTLGGMMALQYIIGQLNGPIQQLLTFIQNWQDAKLSLERLNEIYQVTDEESNEKERSNSPPEDRTLVLNNLSFKYPGAGNEYILKKIHLKIPEKKTTAIVGMSGSGKTTLLKLLLRFYESNEGNILLGGKPLDDINYKVWRQQCGTVMQDGFIFSDSILRNIAIGDDIPNNEKILQSIKIANLNSFMEDLPQGLETKIGAAGNGISQGQRQRILIARAVYKNPHYFFFDEATNSLDSKNETIIMENLKDFLKERTVVVVAHRLSTVRNADNIVVLDKGVIVEQGTHNELIQLRGEYHRLVQNQLELEN